MLDGYTEGHPHQISGILLPHLYKLLCQLSSAGVHCIFVFDGPEHAAHKYKKRLVHTTMLPLIKAFGYDVHMARNEAEADLAAMNKHGIVEAILTEDSDALVFGTPKIMRFIPNERRSDTDTAVDIYTMSTIRRTCNITQDGFVLFTLLVGRDSADGIPGMNAETALALIESGMFNTLVADYARIRTSPTRLAIYRQTLRDRLSQELNLNRLGYLPTSLPAAAKALREADFPSTKRLETILAPITSWSGEFRSRNAVAWRARLPDLEEISCICKQDIGWRNEQELLRKFHSTLWPGLVLRMLISVCTVYTICEY
ncbi:PIN domain-like protein [Lentinula raphanica]|nr:PIN domain-like protein [Lentinula raphanica]